MAVSRFNSDKGGTSDITALPRQSAMAGLHPPAAQGRVNGLERPHRVPARRARLARAPPISLIMAGAGLYAVALVFPLVLRQVNATIFAAAVAGTALVIAGLHIRWTKTPTRA